ncbi:MAG TPA: hemerythrin domain-containing protein [Polyangiaceae bacterium]|nr:hemerythrin domain-containing protein [Polyangiaceae bacterium]
MTDHATVDELTEPRQRRLLVRMVAGAAALALGSCIQSARARGHTDVARANHVPAEVTPGEDLMQEHGLIERVLLVYEEAARRVELGQPLEIGVLSAAIGIVRRFVGDYHERLEERFVFPRLESARREMKLVQVLRSQHERGREVTRALQVRVERGEVNPELASLLRGFVRMYRPHAAREDTILFPAFREVVGGMAYRELGEQFEAQEHAELGRSGFEGMLSEVEKLEDALGIQDLSRFTI